STSKYWDGTGFNSATGVPITASGTTSWSLSFPASNFTADGSYIEAATSIDAAGNTKTEGNNTFTYDNTPPTTAFTFPASGATYDATSWNAGAISKISGTASDATSGVSTDQVAVQQGSGNYWNGTSFSSATPV